MNYLNYLDYLVSISPALFLASMCAAVVGLVKPSLVQFWGGRPSQVTAFKTYTLAAFAFFMLASALTPGREGAQEATAAEETASARPEPAEQESLLSGERAMQTVEERAGNGRTNGSEIRRAALQRSSDSSVPSGVRDDRSTSQSWHSVLDDLYSMLQKTIDSSSQNAAGGYRSESRSSQNGQLDREEILTGTATVEQGPPKRTRVEDLSIGQLTQLLKQKISEQSSRSGEAALLSSTTSRGRYNQLQARPLMMKSGVGH